MNSLDRLNVMIEEFACGLCNLDTMWDNIEAEFPDSGDDWQNAQAPALEALSI